MNRIDILAWLATGLAVGLAPPVRGAAQATAAPQDSTDVLVLDHDFTPGEFVRVFLANGVVYRAELATADVDLTIRARRSGQPQVFVARESAERSPSGGAVYSVRPLADGEYEIRAESGGGGVTNLKLYRDIHASRRRQAVISHPGWEIGIELTGGYHSGYSVEAQGGAVAGASGLDLEGCFAARTGPGVGRLLSGCAFGVGYHDRGSAGRVLWFFMEPRVRVIGGRPRGRSNTEAGFLVRAALGDVDRLNSNPPLLAPGLFLTRNVRHDLRGDGWSATLAWHHGFLLNQGVRGAEYDQLTLGIGRFW